MHDNLRTLVLNANGMPLAIVSWGRGIYLVYDQRAMELDFYADHKVRDGHGRHYTIPAVVVLKRMVRTDRRQAPFCKKNVYLRDALTCAYCGGRFTPKDLTMDHVIPRSKWKGKGTPTTWENIVTCCTGCNVKKGDKTCEQAGMYPMTTPVRPRHGEMFLGLSPWQSDVPREWIPYLSHLPLFKSLQHHEPQATL
jgi:5-methylcytosine-specific restriction endonuclease McrA